MGRALENGLRLPAAHAGVVGTRTGLELFSTRERTDDHRIKARVANEAGRDLQRRKELTAEDGHRLVADIGRIAVHTISCRALAEDAHALANATGRTVYDALYLALAIRVNTRLITADDRLEAGLRNVPVIADYIQLVQTFGPDVPEL